MSLSFGGMSLFLVIAGVGLLLLVAAKPLAFLCRLLLRGAAGAAAFWGLSALFPSFFLLGVNAWTVGTVACFGLPGFLLLLVAQCLLM